MLAYIAHRYSGVPGAVESAARLAAEAIRSGYVVLPPLQVSRGIEAVLDEDGWLAHGLALLLVCDAIIVPEGHQETSRGVRVELATAEAQGIAVVWAREVDGQWQLSQVAEEECPPTERAG